MGGMREGGRKRGEGFCARPRRPRRFRVPSRPRPPPRTERARRGGAKQLQLGVMGSRADFFGVGGREPDRWGPRVRGEDGVPRGPVVIGEREAREGIPVPTFCLGPRWTLRSRRISGPDGLNSLAGIFSPLLLSDFLNFVIVALSFVFGN